MLRFALRFPICLPGVASVHSRIAGDTLGRGVPRLFVRTDAQDTMTMFWLCLSAFPLIFQVWNIFYLFGATVLEFSNF